MIKKIAEVNRYRSFNPKDIVLAQKELLKTFKTPDGFKAEVIKTDSYVSEVKFIDTIQFSNGSIFIDLSLPYIPKKKNSWTFDVALGDTMYMSDGRKYTFTRRGVDVCSFEVFYADVYNLRKVMSIADYTNHLVNGQIVRALAAIERSRSLIDVPGTQFRISSERKSEYTQILLGNGSVSLTPAGFGTGYLLNTKKVDSWSRPNPELAKFFEVPNIFVTLTDHD